MKVIKSDGRYNLFKQGFNTIMEFRMKVKDDRDLFFSCQKAVETIHGLRAGKDENNQLKWNEHYRTQAMSDHKRRRIYLKNESEVSLILLKASVL